MRAFISDCEGPISKNDNAFELTAQCVPGGDRLFTVISRYDDVLADVLKRENYKAGDTLKLILPFLKAYKVTNKTMQDFSAKSLVLIPHVKEALRHIRRIAQAFIVSTSYEHYIRALCEAIDFPYLNTYSTRVDLDRYELEAGEEEGLKRLAQEISGMPIIEIPPRAKSLEDFPEEYRRAVKRLDDIFWKEIAGMKIGKLLNEVNPVGGYEKAEAVRDAAKRANVGLEDVIYVGDSITDVEAFRLVKNHGGLTVSFNGNRYAIREAEVAVLSESSLVTSVIAELFAFHGKGGTLEILERWGREALRKCNVSKELLEKVFSIFPERLPKVELITDENVETLTLESEEFRKRVRGEVVGGLG